MTATKRHCVVTTEHRGVFFGTLTREGDSDVDLTEAQMCVYWAADVKGVLGLASHGPTSGCKVTHSVPKITLNKVTAIIDATDEAVRAWVSSPWR